MKLVPPTDHKFAALHGAVWSGGSFVYVARSFPLPDTETYRKADKIFPLTKKFNAEMFVVRKLDPGKYTLVFDGREPGQRKAQAAAAGIGGRGYVPPRPQPVLVEIKPVD